MSTKNIVPRANGEGSLGTAAKRWGDVQSKKVTSEGEVSAGSVTSTGAITGASAAITGEVSAGSVTSTGAITGASAAITGEVSAGSVTSTGAITGASAAITGEVSAGSVTSTGAITGASAAITGEVSAGSVTSTGAITGASVTVDGKDIKSILLASNAGAHNGIFRGKYLGNALTEAQSAAIQAGTFEDLYIGDYWTINDVDYVIVAFDYYYNAGDTACTTHHAVVVPRNPLYNAQMNSTNVVTGAYVGSAMYTTNLNTAKNTIQSAFGPTHLLTIRQLFQNSVAEGGYENSVGEWYDATVWLMNEFNVYGGLVWKNAYAGTNWRGNYTIDNSQYPGFALDPTMIHTPSRNAYWLRDVATSRNFAYVDSFGDCSNTSASFSVGVRPAFCIK